MKKKFERVFTLFLAALLVVSMAGCGGTPSEPPGEEGNDGGGETVVIRVNSASTPPQWTKRPTALPPWSLWTA